MLLINTFSPNMVKSNFTAHFENISQREAYNWLTSERFTSAISSKEVAHLFGSLLQLPLLAVNVNISMVESDQAILGLYKGPKIRNKQSKLASGASVKWYLITIDNT
jgi:hypothetical protein